MTNRTKMLLKRSAWGYPIIGIASIAPVLIEAVTRMEGVAWLSLITLPVGIIAAVLFTAFVTIEFFCAPRPARGEGASPTKS